MHACRAADIIKSLDVLSLVFLCAFARTQMETLDHWPRASMALCPGSLPSAGMAGGGGGLAETGKDQVHAPPLALSRALETVT